VRRRSTIREPALTASRPSAEPPPAIADNPPANEPAVSNPPPADSADRPRRSGWWSKRLLGRS